MKKIFPLALLLLVLFSACTMPLSAPTPTTTPTATQSPLPSPTATASPSATLTFTPEPTLTPTIMPTIVPVQGNVRANTNVRDFPRKKSERVGGLFFKNTVKVIARNDAATWYYIIFAESPTGTGWVLASAVDLQGDIAQLPIVIYPNDGDTPLMLPPLLFAITGTPLPLNAPAPGSKTARVVQQARVRVGPSIGFVGIGVIEPGAVVMLTGRIDGNGWIQIDYPSGPGGRGWISGDLIKAADGFGDLPFYDILGTPVTPAPPTATLDPNATLPPTETPLPPTATPSGPQGEVLAQINARSGPASTFESYGLLEPGTKVTIAGLTLSGLWYRIEFPASPTGFAWVAAEYVKPLGDMLKVPYFDNLGNPLPSP